MLNQQVASTKGLLLFLAGGLVLGLTAGKLGPIYALILLMAVLFPVVLIRKPEVGLYILALYSLIDYLLKIRETALTGLWDELLFVAIVGTYLVYLVIKARGFDYRLTAMDLPIALFFIVIIGLLFINSPELDVAIDGARVVLQYILWYFVAVNLIKDKVTAKRILNLLIYLTGVIALYGIYQYIIGVEIPTSWYDSKYEAITTRVFSIIGSPNILGSLLVLMLPVTFSFVLNEGKKIKKLIYFLILGSMLLALVYTLSRGAWIALGVAILVYAFFKDRRLIIPVAIVAILAVVAVPQIGDRIAYMLSPEYLASSAKGGRLLRWTAALEAIKESPVIGLGLGRYGGATAMRYEIPGAVYADNFYLKTLAEVGLVGFTAFMFMLYRGLVESLRVIRKTEDKEFYNIGIGIFAGAVGVLAHNAVENVFEVPMMTSYFWLLLAIMISFKFIGVVKPNAKPSEVK